MRTRHGGLLDGDVVVDDVVEGALVVDVVVVVVVFIVVDETGANVVLVCIGSSVMAVVLIFGSSGNDRVELKFVSIALIGVNDSSVTTIGWTVSLTTVVLTTGSWVAFFIVIVVGRLSGNRLRIKRIVEGSALMPAAGGLMEAATPATEERAASAFGLNCCVTLINFVLASMASCSGCDWTKDEP